MRCRYTSEVTVSLIQQVEPYVRQTVEIALFAMVLITCAIRPQAASRFFVGCERRLAQIASHPVGAPLFVATTVIICRLCLLAGLPWPITIGRDESSLRLQAETFLLGRLANPPHPFAAFFESVYVHQAPAYGSMYFPGRGLELALGLGLAGEPGVGVMLVVAAAGAAIVWMLRGWLGANIAFVGGLLFVVRFGLFSPFMNMPYGLASTVLGGILVIGALPRLLVRIDTGAALALALGVALLMLTRPYEGLLLCLPLVPVLLYRLVRLLADWQWPSALRLMVPMIAAVGASGALLLAYNQANTGSAYETPYELNRTDYARMPAFVTQTASVPKRAVPPGLDAFYQAESRPAGDYSTPVHALRATAGKLRNIWSFYFGPLLTIPMIFGLFWLRSRPVLAASFAVTVVGFCFITFSWPHYLTPAVGLLVLISVAGLGALRHARWGPWGLFLSRALPLAIVATCIVPLASLVTGWPRLAPTFMTPCCYLAVPYGRLPVERALAAASGDDLVFVRPVSAAKGGVQWVFNGADIDHQPIIWAHDLGDDKNAALIRYYAGRRVWRVEPVANPEGSVAQELQRP